MNKTEIEAYRQKLTVLQNRLSGDVSHLTNEALASEGGATSSVPIHMADVGTDNFERENTLNLLANEQEQLAEIQEALDRIQQGGYGKCEECESVIPKVRLNEVPYARYCVDCARKLQRRPH